MSWVRLDDHIDEHPKIAQLDDHAFALFVTGLAYCNRNYTNGFIPRNVGVKLRYCAGRPMAAVKQLLGAGLWESVSGGWRIHDYHDYQRSKEELEFARLQKQAAGQAGGQASARARAQANGKQVLKQNPSPVPVPVNRVNTQAAAAAAPLGSTTLNSRSVVRVRAHASPLDDKLPDEVRQRLAQPPLGR
jgi:hypothetical protein